MEMNRARGLRVASVIVCASTPQPASSTVLPAGYPVPAWRRSLSVLAWSRSRSCSRA